MSHHVEPMTVHRRVACGDVSLAVYAWPSPNHGAEPALLIHGYPDCAEVWRDTAERLSQHRPVFAYDVRGAGASTVPKRVRDYRLETLSEDLLTVMQAISPAKPVHLIGHDWGSIQTWESVCSPRFAGRIASFTSISGPCLDHVGHWIRKGLLSPNPRNWAAVLGQLSHSWYIAMFQVPGLAPGLWRAGLGARWPKLLERLEGMADAPTSATQTEDGANGILLYRANMLQRLLAPRPRTTDVPVQLIAPRYDPFVTEAVLDSMIEWVPRLRRVPVYAGHWLPLTRPDFIESAVEDFIAQDVAA
jgi:pimeloyl-ACP methyl ester carboxylesterase